MALSYKTVSNDTWDLIAYKLFGNERYMKNLIEANIELAGILKFDTGTELVIPDIPIETSDNLPFWHDTDDNTIWAEEVE